MRTAPRAAAVLAALTLAACSENAAGVPQETADVVSFQYGGPTAGSWRAAGRLDLSRIYETTWAAARREGGGMQVQAILQHPDGTYDWLTLTLPQRTPGSTAVDPSCSGEDGCPRAMIAFGMRNEDGVQAALSCSLAEGILRVAEAGGGRVRGSFGGTGVCVSSAGEVGEGFVLEGGTFEVPLH